MTLNAKPAFFWDNLLARSGSTLTATSSAPNHPVQNLADWREYLTWQSTDGSAQDITCDCASAQTATACVIYGHNLFSSGRSQVTLYGSNNGSSWTSIFQQSVSSDAVFFKTFSSTNYRYYKVSFNAGSQPLKVPLLFIGNFLEFPSWLKAGFDPNQQETITESNRSESGCLLGQAVKYSQRRITLSFNYLLDDFVRNTLVPFWNTHIPKPFLFAWDRTNHLAECYLVEVSEPKLELPYQPVYRSFQIELIGRVL